MVKHRMQPTLPSWLAHGLYCVNLNLRARPRYALMTTGNLFPPHGNRNVWTEDGLMVIHSRGPWNAEFVREGHTLVLDTIAVFAGQPWLVLGIIHGDGLQTPEAYQIQIESIKAQHALGRKGTALVLADTGNSPFFIGFYRDMYAAAGETMELFPDEASARLWLAQRLTELRANGTA